MVNCPVCNTPCPVGPKLWVATSMRELMLGGWTCRNCKSKIDHKGNLIKKNKNGLKEYEESLYKKELIKEKARLQAKKEHKKK